MLAEVDLTAWKRLAEEVGFARRFLEERVARFVNGVPKAAAELAGHSEHSDPQVEQIVAGIAERAKRFWKS